MCREGGMNVLRCITVRLWLCGALNVRLQACTALSSHAEVAGHSLTVLVTLYAGW